MFIKLETLASLDPSWIGMAVITANPFSRGCAVLVMTSLAHSEADLASPGTPGVKRIARLDATIALVLALLPTLAAARWFEHPEAFAVAVVPALAITVWIRRTMRKRLAGYTGDGLSATQQLAETAYYLGLLAWWTLSSTPIEAPTE
jgi:adenosylcobinamide-GDP ribazoletransferase